MIFPSYFIGKQQIYNLQNDVEELKLQLNSYKRKNITTHISDIFRLHKYCILILKKWRNSIICGYIPTTISQKWQKGVKILLNCQKM